MYDLLIKNVYVEDPANGVSGRRDIAIKGGFIAETAPSIPPSFSRAVLDMHGATAIPGIIDSHVHVCGHLGDVAGFAMLVRAGVCTALNMAGPVGDVLAHMNASCGLQIATLEDVSPERIGSDNPSLQAAGRFVDEALDAGALGIKLLGGHFPLTPDASARLLQAAHDKDAYVAWHAGTTKHGSDIEGMREAVEIADGLPLHLAHINSYCRGRVRHELAEVMEAQQLLEENPSIISESYLSAANGTSLRITDDGTPASNVTAGLLKRLGFEVSQRGLEDAILAGKAFVLTQCGDEIIRVAGQEGLSCWREAATDVCGSFDVNPPAARVSIALARRKSGDFSVDCLSTDGGSFPRNVIVSQGLGIVAAGLLPLADFVRKTSWNPSRCLRLTGKGHLGTGADADITVLDMAACRPLATIIGGHVCMIGGHICASQGTVITTERGRKIVESLGLRCMCVDMSQPRLPISQTR